MIHASSPGPAESHGSSDSYFAFLDRTLNLLFVDDQDLVRDVLTETFSPIRLYSLVSASCARDAISILESGTRFHACIMDLGLVDVDGDEFALLKRFGGGVSFVVLTGSQFPSKGFDSYRLGARAVFEKVVAFDDLAMVKTVNKLALLNIINPRHRETSFDTTAVSTNVLFNSSPETVTEWARELGITDRQLRKIWKGTLGFSAKHSLFVYHLYQQAFQYYEALVEQPDAAPGEVLPIESASYRKLEQYYHLHRSTIIDLIR